MSDEAKSIKFKFVVDEQSAQRVNAVLDGMIKRAETLMKTLQGVGIGGAGLMGGGTVTGGGRPPSAQSTMATSGSSTQKVSFASVLTQNVDMFKKIAQEGGVAMKALGDAVNKGSDHQRREIDKLQRSLENLAKTYDRLGGSGGQHADKLQQKILGVQQRISGHQGQLAKLQSMAPPGGPHQELMPEVPWPTAAGPSRFSRFRGWLNSGGGIGGEDLTMANMSRNMGRIPGLGFLGGAGGGMALAGAGAFMGFGLKAAQTAASGAYNAPQLSQANRLGAAEVGPASYARKLRAGDLSDIRAMSDITQDSDKRREYGEISGEGSGFWNWTRRQGIGMSAASKAFGRGEFGDAISNLFSGTDSVDAQNVVKGRKRSFLTDQIEENGVREDIFRDSTANSLGKMGIMRALGIGGGYKKNGAYVSSSEAFLNQFSQFDQGEVIGAVHGISGSGSRRAALSRTGLLSSVLQAQSAGITGAANIGGVFGRTGGADGAGMVNLLRAIAGGGTDVTTTGLIGSHLADVQGRYNAPGMAGAGAVGALSYGTQGEDGNLIARQNIAGMGSFGRLLSGSRDPAQAALNFAIARRSAPGAGYYAQHYLASGLTPERMADLRAGNLNPTAYERNMGIDEGMLQRQVDGVTQSQVFRVMPKGFGAGSMVGDFARDVAASGDIKASAAKVFGGSEQAQVEGFAAYLKAGDPNHYADEGTALGAAREQLFGMGSKGTKGRMVGDVAGGSVEAKQAKEEANVREVDRQLKDANIKEIETQISKESEAYKRLVGVSGNLAITAETISTIIAQFAKNLKAAAGGPPGGGAKVAPKKE